MADTNTLGQVPESNNIDSLYTEVDNTLSLVHEVPSTITETSIHNITSVNLGTDRKNDDSLKINKDEKVSLQGLEDKKNTYAPTANLDVAHFADKRFISKQLSDKNDTVIMADLDKEIIRSYETDVVLANALNLEDEEREIADAQLRADIAKEALERANADSNLAEIIEKYKYAMSQHITTRELDVNGDTRLNIEVVDGDNHGGNLDVETSLVVGSKNAENGTTTSEGKVIGDAHIKHDLFVDNDTTIGNDLLVENDSHIMNDLLVDQNATIEGNLDVNGTTTLNELEVENNLSIGGNLKVEGDTDLDKTLNVDGAVTLNDTLTVEKDTTLKDDLIVNKTATIDGATKLNDTLTVEKATALNDALTVEKATALSDTLTVEKATQLNDTLTTEGATTLKDVLNVKKSTTLEDALTVDKSTQLNDTLTVNNSTQLNDTLDVKKATTLEDTLNVKKGTLLEDTLQVNKRTDIGTDQTNADLYVHGSEYISNNLNVTETSNLGTTNIGTAEANKNLTVNGNELISGTLNVNGKTTVNNELEVLNATVLKSTLNVNGNTDLDSTLNVDGATSLKSTLNVTGKSTLGTLSAGTTDLGTTTVGTSSNKKNLTVNGNESVSGTLNVTGKSTLGEVSAGTTTIGTSSANKNLTVNGNETVSGTLNVSNKSTLNDVDAGTTVIGTESNNKNLTVNGNANVTGTFDVDGKTTLSDLDAGTTTIGSDENNKNLIVKGNASISGTLGVTGKSTLGTVAAGTTTIGTSSSNKNLTVNGNETISGTLGVTGKSTLGTVAAGTTTIGTTSANKNLTVNGSETITGNLNVNTNTDLDGTLNVGGETTLNANVKIKDDSNTQKSFSDIIGTIKNALVKDFTQSYNSTTGQLTSTLTFNNLYSGNTNRPTVSTITKTINLDLEKYILDINDVYATKTISNGKTTYTDFDISTLTDEEIRDLDSPDYTGNIVRCLKVKYNTYNNTNAGTEKSYVYFEINDIFKSIISKLELEINNEITARNNAITNAINNLDVASVGSNGGYIKTISETNGKISAARQPFDTSISSSSTANNAPTSKAVYDFIGTLDVAAVGQDGSYLKTISETNGKISATTQSFDTAINANSTDNNVPTSKAVKTYVSQEINNLDVASVGSDGGYIKTISETNGKISAARQPFDTTISSTSTNNNAPTSKAIYDYLNQKITGLDVAAVGEPGSYLQTISESDGKISATTQSFDTAIDADSTDDNAPTSKAVKTYVSQEINNLDVASVGSMGGYILAISEANGKISANRVSFDSTITTSSVNAPNSKAVYDFVSQKIGALDVDSVGVNGSYIKTISETNGKVSATTQAFDTSISSTSTANNAPTSKAVYDFIGTLDVASVGSDGGYIKTISETNGKISATTQAFDTTVSSTSTNAPTSKAVYDFIGTLDVATVGENGKYLKTISETNGKISATTQAFDTTVSSTSTNAPTSKAICAYLKSHEKTITLKDAAGNTLLSFVCYAPDATAYSPSLGTITLNTTTIV